MSATQLAGILPNSIGQIPSMNGGISPSTMAVSIANQVAASTSDVSAFAGTLKGTQNVPANGPYDGNTYRIRAAGTITTPAVNVATLTCKFKWGSTVISSMTTPAIASLLTAARWSFVGTMTIRSVATPSSATVVCEGELSIGGVVVSSMVLATAVTIDTTVLSKLDLTLAFSTVAGSQTMTSIMAIIEILY